MNKPMISLVDLETAPEDVKKVAQAHLDQGWRLTNEKRTLLHNAVAFHALEGMSYAVSAEMKKFVSHRAANLFQYAISLENDCLVCCTYYKKFIHDLGYESLDEIDLTDDEQILVEYARAIANDPKHVPDELLQRLLKRFGEEALVVFTTMAMFMIGNNYFNDILRVQSELLPPVLD